MVTDVGWGRFAQQQVHVLQEDQHDLENVALAKVRYYCMDNM